MPSWSNWSATFERECALLIDATVTATGADRERHWQDLLVRIAPHIETWAAKSRALARWRIHGEDDVRAVLVAVLGRLGRDEYQALRRFRAREVAEDEADEQVAAVDRLARLAGDDTDTETPAEVHDPRDTGTPFRALLLTLVKRAAADHVRYRLGWTDEGGRRVVGTDAQRLSDAPEPAARPPITDYVTVRKLLDDIDSFARGFPAPMQSALRLWMHDAPFSDIAEKLALADEGTARNLVRAAHARLRDRFRGEWAAIF